MCSGFIKQSSHTLISRDAWVFPTSFFKNIYFCSFWFFAGECVCVWARGHVCRCHSRLRGWSFWLWSHKQLWAASYGFWDPDSDLGRSSKCSPPQPSSSPRYFTMARDSYLLENLFIKTKLLMKIPCMSSSQIYDLFFKYWCI